MSRTWYIVRLLFIKFSMMVAIDNTNSSPEPKGENKKKLDWENPKNPEDAQDPRDTEKLLRQKKEGELRKEKLSSNPEKDK